MALLAAQVSSMASHAVEAQYLGMGAISRFKCSRKSYRTRAPRDQEVPDGQRFCQGRARRCGACIVIPPTKRGRWLRSGKSSPHFLKHTSCISGLSKLACDEMVPGKYFHVHWENQAEPQLKRHLAPEGDDSRTSGLKHALDNWADHCCLA